MKVISILVLSLAVIDCSEAAVFYVKAGAPSGNNGSSWAKAFNNLDQALTAAKKGSGNQIWIAAGTYKPSVVCSGACAGGYVGTAQQQGNLKTFYLPSNVAIYGGFAGTETQLSQRNIAANPTILSGDLAGDDVNSPTTTLSNKADNTWHVITADGVTGVSLDSLIISGGYAGGPDAGSTSGRPFFEIATLDYSHGAGGGLLARHGANLSLSKVTFNYNAADGVNSTLVNPGFAAITGGISPVLTAGGGAICAEDHDTIITVRNSTFDRNTAVYPGANGGAINIQLEATLNVYSSTFTNNIADRDGGAIRGKDAKLIYVSASTFQNNAVNGMVIPDASGGGIGVINSNLTVTNSVFRNNASGFLAGGGGIVFHTIFDDGEPYALNVSNSFFDSNTAADIGGGGINLLGFNNNVGTSATVSNCVFTNNSGGVGGAIYADAIPLTVTNSGFSGNQAWVSGGAIFASNFGDAAFAVSTPFTPALVSISNSSFSSNSIVGVPAGAPPPFAIFNAFAGGLVFLNGDPNIDHPYVTSMDPGGGAIAVQFDGVAKISNSTFVGNSAPGASGGAILAGGSFGAPNEMNFANVKVSNSSCSGNTAASGNNSALLNPSGIVGAVTLSVSGSCQ